MPLWFFPALMGVLAVISLVAGTWLLLHLQDLAATFSGRADGEMVRGPGKRRASKGSVWLALIAFNAGWIGCLLICMLVIGGEADTVTDAAA